MPPNFAQQISVQNISSLHFKCGLCLGSSALLRRRYTKMKTTQIRQSLGWWKTSNNQQTNKLNVPTESSSEVGTLITLSVGLTIHQAWLKRTWCLTCDLPAVRITCSPGHVTMPAWYSRHVIQQYHVTGYSLPLLYICANILFHRYYNF